MRNSSAQLQVAVEQKEGKEFHSLTGANDNRLHIIYGSRTGNSRAAAELAYGYSEYLGLDSQLIDMAAINTADFSGYKNILLAVSTHGEGDPPAVAEMFYNFIHSKEAPDMTGVRFSILALGDSSYRDYCKTGRDFGKRFRELGAKEIYRLTECDIDYEENAKAWVNYSVSAFKKVLRPVRESLEKGFAFEINKRESDHENAFYARVIEKRFLTRPGYEKRTLHLALSMEGYTGKFLPGDSFGVYMKNSRLMVDSLLKELKYDGTIAVNSDTGKKLLKEALISDYDITMLTPVVIGKYAELTSNRELGFLLKNRTFLDEYSSTRNLLDLVKDYPSDIEPEALLSVLRNLAPRLYSVASSPLAIPGELHFTVGLIEYKFDDRHHRGVCSVYFADRVDVGDSVPVFLEKNEKFRLTEDDSQPLIMIGTGTGIAPYRAFLQQRKFTGATGENWLFFGDRFEESDFLYREEIGDFLASGLLTRLNTAFSREQSEKVYVQHHLLKHKKEVFDWIDRKKAVVYICGNKRTMGQSVKSCLEQIISSEGGFTPAETLTYIQNMKSDKRYQTDLY
jgi:sulfite reductase (NADPH) flavoprotein alpha-component